MLGRSSRGQRAATAIYAVSFALLLRRMRHELLTDGRLSPPTAVWMYATYGIHGAASAYLALGSGGEPAPRPMRWAGSIAALGGVGLCAAGSSRFGGIRQISGTEAGEHIADGVYRCSRNPQYTGLIMLLFGLALARRSPGAAAFAAAAAGAYRWWVPVEEAHLEATFGETYRHYRDRTPRWFGRPKRLPHDRRA